MECPCLLHSRPYRAIYEEMVNNLSSCCFSYQRVTLLRTQQSAALCSCTGALGPFPRAAPPDSNDMSQTVRFAADKLINATADLMAAEATTRSPEASTQQTSAESAVTDAGPECTSGPGASWTVLKVDRAKEIAEKAQSRLTALSQKKGDWTALKASILRLGALVQQVYAAPEPAPERKVPAVNSYARRGIAMHRRRGVVKYHRRYCQPLKQRPPPKPYAPLRWPPLRVTMAVLKGQPLPAVQSCPAHQQRSGAGGFAGSSTSDMEDEEFAGLVEMFEEKLQVLQRQRRAHRGRQDRLAKDRLDDPLTAGPLSRPCRHFERDRSCHHSLQKLKQQQQQRPRGPKLRDSAHTLGVSKCAAKVAELWPYK